MYRLVCVLLANETYWVFALFHTHTDTKSSERITVNRTAKRNIEDEMELWLLFTTIQSNFRFKIRMCAIKIPENIRRRKSIPSKLKNVIDKNIMEFTFVRFALEKRKVFYRRTKQTMTRMTEKPKKKIKRKRNTQQNWFFGSAQTIQFDQILIDDWILLTTRFGFYLHFRNVTQRIRH